ncbi:hypothetical protein AMTRI_Chr10g6420 [Amborella trichopoda]
MRPALLFLSLKWLWLLRISMASAFLCEGTSSHGSSSIAPQITDPFASPLKKLETIKTTSAKKPKSKKMDRFGTSRVQNFLSLNLSIVGLGLWLLPWFLSY